MESRNKSDFILKIKNIDVSKWAKRIKNGTALFAHEKSAHEFLHMGFCALKFEHENFASETFANERR